MFIYLLTSPLANIAGAYEITIDRICFDTDLNHEEVQKFLAEFEVADKVFFKNNWIFIQNFIKNQSINPSIEKGIVTVFNCCPDWVKDRLYTACHSLSHYLNLNLNINRNKNKNRNKNRLTEAKASSVSSGSIPSGVREVFEYWQTTFNHHDALLDSKRQSKIKARLKEKFTVEKLKTAIDGVKNSPWHIENKQDELCIILRDAPQVEKFLGLATQPALAAAAGAEVYRDPITGEGLV